LVETVKVRFEIKLPIYYNNGLRIEAEKHDQTQEEIFEKFGAYTLQTVTRGIWRDPDTNKSYEEKIGGIIVDVDREQLNDTIAFLREYKQKLKERFQQEEIYIVGYELYVI
jgi:hypothetical protein